MNILFIAPRVPLPADTGGKIRTFNILKEIAKKCSVHLLCFSFEKEDKEHVAEFEKLGIKVTLVPISEPNIFKKIITVLTDKRPYSVAKYYSQEMEQAVKKSLCKEKFDIVHFDHIHTTHYSECLENIPCFVDEHNVEYKILERCAKVEKSIIKNHLYIKQAEKMKCFEAKNIKNLYGSSAVSDDDAQLLRELVGEETPVYVLPNGVDTGYFAKKENRKWKGEGGETSQKQAKIENRK